MKIAINLASQPFQKNRGMIAASIVVSLALMATLGVLISLAMSERVQLADARSEVNRLNAQIRRVSGEQAQLDAVLRRPENAEVLERSVFINTLLYRKGISWTRIFADLEKVLPYNVKVIQIHPSVDAEDHVILDMQVGSASPEPVIDFLKALANAPFSVPEVKTQQAPSQAEPLYRFRLTVEYAQKL